MLYHGANSLRLTLPFPSNFIGQSNSSRGNSRCTVGFAAAVEKSKSPDYLFVSGFSHSKVSQPPSEYTGKLFLKPYEALLYTSVQNQDGPANYNRYFLLKQSLLRTLWEAKPMLCASLEGWLSLDWGMVQHPAVGHAAAAVAAAYSYGCEVT